MPLSSTALEQIVAGRLKKKYDITGDVRDELVACGNEWAAALGPRAYLGGAAPNLADLAVFGVMRSIVGTDTFHDILHADAVDARFAAWYERMMAVVGPSACKSAV